MVVGSPRVDLLPPEIGARNKAKAVRRGLRAIILLTVVVVVVAIGGAWYLTTNSVLALVAEQHRTTALAQQKNQFADVSDAQRAIELGAAAQRVAGSTEIDWQDYLQQLQASLPAGVTLTAVVTDSENATTAFPQSDVPLEGARIATLTFTATSATLPIIPDWLDALRKLPGFVDATPGSVTIDQGGYTVSITMHINDGAFSYRFTPELDPSPEPTDTSDTTETTETTDTTGTTDTTEAKK
jgi:Tfp pilus assembly protein PilN